MAEFNLINRVENMVDYLLTITDKAPKSFVYARLFKIRKHLLF